MEVDAYTYAEIEGMSNKLARDILQCIRQRKGIRQRMPDEPKVAILVEEGVGLVVCMLAVLKTGITA